jgi:beta-lactam-binding protein with PASTA domain
MFSKNVLALVLSATIVTGGAAALVSGASSGARPTGITPETTVEEDLPPSTTAPDSGSDDWNQSDVTIPRSESGSSTTSVPPDDGGGSGPTTTLPERAKEYVPVPEVIGMTAADAKRTLARTGLTYKLVPYYLTRPGGAGNVVEQNPRTGTKVPTRSTVHIAVGVVDPSKWRYVPSVVGKTGAEAVSLIQSRDLVPSVDYVKVSTADREGVISVNPPAGSRMIVGEVVTITVGYWVPGNVIVIEPTQLVAVPKVIGHTWDNAKQILEAEGFDAVLNTVGPVPGCAGMVYLQQPSSGQLVQHGSQVRVDFCT